MRAHLRKQHSPVTIIVGLKFQGGIVLACDSQTTRGTTKRIDTNKIAKIRFANDKLALVAQAGSSLTSSRVIEILQSIAIKTELSEHWGLAEIASKAMRQMKDEMRIQQGDCSMEELRDYIDSYGMTCELMLAHYFHEQPYIYTIDLVHGIAAIENSIFASLGCGANVGEYILSHLPPVKDNLFGALANAVYVIEKVKTADAFCGGPTNAGIIKPDEIMEFDQRTINEVVRALDEHDTEIKKYWHNAIAKVLVKMQEAGEASTS